MPHCGNGCQANLLNWYWKRCDGWGGIGRCQAVIDCGNTCKKPRLSKPVIS